MKKEPLKQLPPDEDGIQRQWRTYDEQKGEWVLHWDVNGRPPAFHLETMDITGYTTAEVIATMNDLLHKGHEGMATHIDVSGKQFLIYKVFDK